MDSNFKPNSHRYKEEKKDTDRKLEKVVNGVVKTKKRSDARRFADIFIAEDVSNVKNYVFMDVLVPAVKKAISDIVRDGIDMILYGDSGRNKNKSNGGNYISYGSSFRSSGRDDHYSTNEGRFAKSRYDFDDIIFETRGDAEFVRERMDEVIDTYNMVTVADYYDLAGITPPYTSNNFGWKNISTADIVRLRNGGYVIKLPRPMAIDK